MVCEQKKKKVNFVPDVNVHIFAQMSHGGFKSSYSTPGNKTKKSRELLVSSQTATQWSVVHVLRSSAAPHAATK